MRLQFEKVIIGNSLLALSAAYYEGVPVLVQGRPQYYFFDEYCYLQTRETRKSSDVWKEVSFQLTLAGLMPFGDLITSIREEEDFIEVITRDGKKHQVYCDKKEIVKIKNQNIKNEKSIFLMKHFRFFYDFHLAVL